MTPEPRVIHRVSGWRDVPLHVPEWGNPDGQPILLIHGWSQAHQSWARQLDSALDQFRLIAPDLRGHGASAKPNTPDHYDTSEPWAGDVAAIIAALNLDNPLLVGWSMGGWVVQDYLKLFGDSGISGFVLIGSSMEAGSHVPDEALQQRQNDEAASAAGMYDTHVSRNLSATVDFVRACFHQPPEPDALAMMVGFNMLCSPKTRTACRFRNENYRATLQACEKPGLVLWGRHERLAVPPMPQRTAEAIPNATTLEYDNSGHAPFWEEAARFNADLAAFATTCANAPEKELIH